ncbi:Small auxin-up RNA [Dillenia turbinata]|uniref:Small auxin-up RNA n=1 Tax=Dillenia turbinata TaxID=194707 RepID=A0AAN8VKE6_9MAGN
MKQLIRRLSRVADSSQYCLLRSNSLSSPPARPRHAAGKLRRKSSASVPEGYLPVYVGDEMERFVQPESESGILSVGFLHENLEGNLKIGDRNRKRERRQGRLEGKVEGKSKSMVFGGCGKNLGGIREFGNGGEGDNWIWN